ncbi:two-component system C4-dicarboxylate transport response regulator DctD [Pseudochelatococcus lubricantis]|uniref:Two-component system C4-dicarboxylate transport response regulator DctD n=1 Tax=Pseudochelatococcus lubricantis TaxID=1538102 RepID=A0ABX0UZE7_9HYPH|nr:sigma-54 dependent transcriptional regulator [Pseudochelatococcus lubricantis]NIJ58337.1 two-component system C4-dicarboxylate transport response regulator DctD [Pseudochelatococcus lubricantis]
MSRSDAEAGERIDVAFVDDDAEVRRANVQTLELAGLDVRPFETGAQLVAAIDAGFPGAVVTDVRMPGMDGFQLFRRLREIDADIPVILITGHGDIDMAVEAMHKGAYDFIAKPYSADRLVQSVQRAVEKRRLVLENRRLRDAAAHAQEDVPLIGQTPVMERLRQTLRQIAIADVDVLVNGETGSGKEVAAELLHRWSRRREGRFVALNCGALPENVIESELFGHEAGAFTGALKKRIGHVEYSSGGTLFLDEIESMPLAAQAKLLRVLEKREVVPLGGNESRQLDLRVIAAAKIDLGDPAVRGDFREDLYFRLNVVSVTIPPLRERRDDIPLLFVHFLNRAAARFGIEPPDVTPALREFLSTHPWPGNVRELAHAAERHALGLLDVPAWRDEAESDEKFSLPRQMELYEAELIRKALKESKGNAKAAIDALGIPRKTFYDKLQRHGLVRSDFV